MNKYYRMTLLVLSTAILSSCQSLQMDKGTQMASGQGGPEIFEVDAAGNEAQLMVREFLLKNDGGSHFYNYYSYLIVSENSESNLDKRLAVFGAFMCEFSDVSKALKMGLTPDELVVFYAPINPGEDISKLKRSTSAESLMSVYNYDYSRAMANEISNFKTNRKLSIAIVSYPLPLRFTGAGFDHISEDALNVIDLSGIPPAQIRKTIETFRRSVTGSYEFKEVLVTKKVDPDTGAVVDSEIMRVPVLEHISNKDWANKMRVVFASLGAFMESFTPIAQAAAEPSCR